MVTFTFLAILASAWWFFSIFNWIFGPWRAFWADTAPFKGPWLASCVFSGITVKQGHRQVWCTRCRGPRTPSKTADWDIDCALPIYTDPWLWKVNRIELSEWPDSVLAGWPHSLRRSTLRSLQTQTRRAVPLQPRPVQVNTGFLGGFLAINSTEIGSSWVFLRFSLSFSNICLIFN